MATAVAELSLENPEDNPLRDFLQLYYHDPVRLVREVFAAEPDEWQCDLLTSVARGERGISVRSGHGVGKTTALAWVICWWVLTRFPQRCVATAATTAQLFDALVADTMAWMKKLPPALLSLFELKSDRIELRYAPEESYVSFRTSRPETPEALAGVHSENVLLIADEASGVHAKIFEAAAGSMTSERATMILTGNPVRRSGLFYDTHMKPEVMPLWHRIHVSCTEVKRITPKYIAERKAEYGEESNAFRVRVLGEFPLADDDTVIPYEWVHAALTRDVTAHNVKPIWGLDVARKGRDACALAKRKGNVVYEKVDRWRGYDLMQTVGRVKNEWDKTLPSERPSVICIDVIGLGSGVYDRLRELGLPVRAINVAESASMDSHYPNLRSELWFKGRAWFERKDCYIGKTNDVLLAQLTTVTFDYTSAGKQQVQPKKELPESPNDADAFLLTFAAEAVIAGGNASHADWNKPVSRKLKGLV